MTGKPLPTSKEREEFLLPDGKKVLGSIVDAGGAAVFLRAEDFGLKGTEGIEIGGNAELLEKLMAVRGQAVQRWQDAERLSPAVPDVVLVQGAKDCRALDGTPIQAEEMDILARCFCMGQLHRTFPITTAIALGAAAKIPGTTVQEALGARAEQEELRIGNLSGVLPLMLQAQGIACKARLSSERPGASWRAASMWRIEKCAAYKKGQRKRSALFLSFYCASALPSR